MRYLFVTLLMFLSLQSTNIRADDFIFNLGVLALGFGANLVIPEDVALNKGVNYTATGLLSASPSIHLSCFLLETTVYRNVYSYDQKINSFFYLMDNSRRCLESFFCYTVGKEMGRYCHRNLKQFIYAKLKKDSLIEGY